MSEEIQASNAKRIPVPGGFRFIHHGLKIPNWVFAPVAWTVEDLKTIARRRHQTPPSEADLRGAIAFAARGDAVPLLKFVGSNDYGTLHYRPNAMQVFLGPTDLRNEEWHVPAGVRAQAVNEFERRCIGLKSPRFMQHSIDVLPLEAASRESLRGAGIETLADLCGKTENEVALTVGTAYSIVAKALTEFGLHFRKA